MHITVLYIVKAKYILYTFDAWSFGFQPLPLIKRSGVWREHLNTTLYWNKKKEECHLINNRSINLKTYCRIHMQITVTIIAFHYFNIAYFKKIRVNKEWFCYTSSLALLGLDKQTHTVHHAIKKSTFSERRLWIVYPQWGTPTEI